MMGLKSTDVVAVVGAGVMGEGIAQVAAAAGHNVLLFDADPVSASRAMDKIGSSTAKLVEKGKLESQSRLSLLSRIQVVEEVERLAGSALVIEAIVEDLSAKAELFMVLERLLGPNALIATNTSSLSVTELAGSLKHPEKFAGLHFFNPAPVMQLVEVVGGLRTDDHVLATLLETMKAWGKSPVPVRNAPGFIVNRGARPFYSEALKFAEEGGADFATIDALFRGNGFRMGPLELIDLVGLDINLSASRSMWQAYYAEPRYRPSRLVEERVAAGLLGKKSGEGFYRYPAGQVHESKFLLGMPPPKEVTIHGDVGPAGGLIDLLRTRGIEADRTQGEGWISVDGTRLALTDGRMTCERGPGWVVFDLCLDWSSPGGVALCSHDRAALERAAGLFQAVGLSAVEVQDLPGMLLARTICLLINEACDLVLNGIAGEDEVDLAMRLGLNFPGGPFDWLRLLGPAYVIQVLDNMAACYGDGRYRASVHLRRLQNL